MKIIEATENEVYDDPAVEEYIATKIAEGKKVRIPAFNEVFIDIDAQAELNRFYSALKRLKESFPDIQAAVTPSKSGPPHFHVVVCMPFPLSAVERIAWQAIMGSDPTRELLAMLRVRRGEDVPTLFVEEP